MFETIRADLREAYRVNGIEGWWGQHIGLVFQRRTIAVLHYRFGRWARAIRTPGVRQAMMAAAAVLRYAVEQYTGVHIAPSADIGPGLVVHLPWAIFIGGTTIGRNCTVQTGVVISWSVRRVGNDTYFGAGAKVMGKVSIGDNVLVAPNSLVVNDIPDNLTVVGVPARIRLPRRRKATRPERNGAAPTVRQAERV